MFQIDIIVANYFYNPIDITNDLLHFTHVVVTVAVLKKENAVKI